MNVAAELAALVRSIAGSLVVVADDSLGNEGGEVVVGVPADTFNSDGDVGSAHGIVTDTDIGADEVSLLLGEKGGVVLAALVGETREVLLSELDDLLVGNTTRVDEDHAVGSVVVLDVVGELGTGNVANVLAGAENGATERLVLESSGVKVIKNDLLDLLLNLLGLAEDDVALTLDSRRLKLGVLENVGDDVDTLGDVGVEGLCEVDGVLALDRLSVPMPVVMLSSGSYRGVRVEVATHVLDLQLELLLSSLGSALGGRQYPLYRPWLRRYSYLEGKVLEEVCSAVGLLGLCPRASVYPDSHRACLSPWRVVGRDLVSSVSV